MTTKIQAAAVTDKNHLFGLPGWFADAKLREENLWVNSLTAGALPYNRDSPYKESAGCDF